MNPALAVTGTIPDERRHGDVIGARPGGPAVPALVVVARAWFEHQNLRDERVEAFASLLWEGVYTLQLRRARDHAGRVRRAAAEGGGDVRPETFGRGATDRVVVE